MFNFLALPTEIRDEIYRHLRRYISISLSLPVENSASFGYASYGFHWNILATNKQISYEAKQVFYGENDWTFYAAPDIPFYSDDIMLPPLCSAMPFIRRANIKFRMLDWLYQTSVDIPYRWGSKYIRDTRLRENVNHLSKILNQAPCLQSLKLFWTETSKLWPLAHWQLELRHEPKFKSMQRHIGTVLQPLNVLELSCAVLRSDVMVKWSNQAVATYVQKGFCEAVDELMTSRELRLGWRKFISDAKRRKAIARGDAETAKSE